MTVAPDLTVAGVAVVIASSAVLCPDCLGDWCDSCDWTGLSQPTRLAILCELPPRPVDAVTESAA